MNLKRTLTEKTASFSQRSDVVCFTSRSLRGFDFQGAKGSSSSSSTKKKKKKNKAIKTGNKKLDKALRIGTEVFKVAGMGADAAKSISLAGKNLSSIVNSRKELKLKKETLELKKAELADLSARTALWERSLDQSEKKKELLSRQLSLKEDEMSKREEATSAGTIKVKGFTRKDGVRVKPSTRKKRRRKSTGIRRKRK